MDAWVAALLLKPLAGLLLLAGFAAIVGVGILGSKIAARFLGRDHWLTREFKRDRRSSGPADSTDSGLQHTAVLLGDASKQLPGPNGVHQDLR
jgi:hypothetical protein